jgi:hypothetical protein
MRLGPFMAPRKLIANCLFTLAASVGASAVAGAETPPPAKPPPCAAPEHRQFDFWQGDWDVRDPSGKTVGRNRIVPLHGGCVLQENWASTNGVTGTSVNIYDGDTRRWHQTWVDSTGGLLQLDGGIVDGKMVLAGESVAGPPAKTTRHRIAWTPLPDGRVRQLWESSDDGGKTWTVAFDGLYSKRTSVQ